LTIILISLIFNAQLINTFSNLSTIKKSNNKGRIKNWFSFIVGILSELPIIGEVIEDYTGDGDVFKYVEEKIREVDENQKVKDIKKGGEKETMVQMQVPYLKMVTDEERIELKLENKSTKDICWELGYLFSQKKYKYKLFSGNYDESRKFLDTVRNYINDHCNTDKTCLNKIETKANYKEVNYELYSSQRILNALHKCY
jgi:hypothetical protein